MNEQEEMEQYNRAFNDKLNARPVNNLKRCDGIKKPPKIIWHIKWKHMFDYKFAEWKKLTISQNVPCGWPHYLSCKICKGKGYVFASA